MGVPSGYSKACCSIPPVQGMDYKGVGKWQKIGGYDTYVTGSAKATKALLFIYDIFGKDFPQTIQGADILASGEDGYQVFMPDYFHGEAADIAWYPPDTDEKMQKLGAWFKKMGDFTPAAGKYMELLKDIEKEYESIKTWGVVGFCWGGKLVSIMSSSKTSVPFKAGAEVHPGMIDPADAAGITIPICILASEEESAEEVQAFADKLKGEKHIERFEDQVHGWMTARGNLKDEKVKKEYERGYKILLDFFGKYM